MGPMKEATEYCTLQSIFLNVKHWATLVPLVARSYGVGRLVNALNCPNSSQICSEVDGISVWDTFAVLNSPHLLSLFSNMCSGVLVWTVFALISVDVTRSNTIWGTNACVCVVLCLVRVRNWKTVKAPQKGIRTINNNNLIIYYLCAESTATRPITDTAQCRCRQLNNWQTHHRVKGKLQEPKNAKK
jgi:hypothetical protein